MPATGLPARRAAWRFTMDPGWRRVHPMAMEDAVRRGRGHGPLLRESGGCFPHNPRLRADATDVP